MNKEPSFLELMFYFLFRILVIGLKVFFGVLFFKFFFEIMR